MLKEPQKLRFPVNSTNNLFKLHCEDKIDMIFQPLASQKPLLPRNDYWFCFQNRTAKKL